MPFRHIFLLCLVLKLTSAFSQCSAPTAITAPSTVCIGQKFEISAAEGYTYNWDFCAGDFLQATTPIAVHSSSLPFYLELVNDGNYYRGFVVNGWLKTLTRLDFINGLDNAPVISNVGFVNPPAFNDLRSIRIIEENGAWFGLVTDLARAKLYRLNFGPSLSNLPTVEELDVPELNLALDLAILKEGSDYFALITNYGANYVTNVRFPGSITAAPQVLPHIDIPGSNAFSIAVKKVCSNWIGFAALNGSSSICRIDMGSSLAAVSASTKTYTGFSSVTGISFQEEYNGYYLFAGSGDGKLTKMTLGQDASSDPVNLAPPATLLTGTSTAWGVSMLKDGTDWHLFFMDYNNSQVNQFLFQNPCNASIQFSSSSGSVLSYSTSGTKNVALSLSDGSGHEWVVSKQVLVQNSISPDIDFSFQNICASNPTLFTSSNVSGDITSYAWDFGDSGASSGSNPAHTYSAAGTYSLGLTVTSSNGCTNEAGKTIQVFNAPQANFSLPPASPFCTNQNYTFANTTTYDAGSNPTWQWSVNGSNAATTQDLNYLFASSSPQSITLAASIPGCSSQSTQNIPSIELGPLVSFTSSLTGCQGATVPFTNTTTDPVTSFLWTFGDGNSSSANNSSNTYTSAGPYQITLSATNAAGCQNSSTKNISIYSAPQPDFSIEAPPLSCEQSLSQFDNLTPPLADSNIISWLWSFADAANGSSSQKNPTYTYSTAGDYNVTLQSTSNFGCSNTVQKRITILPSPRALFSYPKACVDQSTVFTSTSQGGALNPQWSIENNLVTGSSLSHIFASSGSFPISLTVTSANGCVNRKDSVITVPVKPNLSFSVQAPCTLHPAIFSETSANQSDPAVSDTWSFGVGSGMGLTTKFQFPASGPYPLTLTSTRLSGCVYSLSNNIIMIYDGPVANFTPSVLAGGAPLTVSFVNNSPSDTNLWNFGDHVNTAVNSLSPSFTYSSLGAYKVILTTKNLKGCSDTTSAVINVVIPNIDIVMNSFSLSSDPNSNTSKPVIGISNSGNIPLVDPEVLLDLGGGVLLKGKISGTVKPGNSVVETLDLQIVPQAIQYVCAEIDVADDVNLSNNKQCISLTNEDVLMNPYPNPSGTGQVTLQWVGAAQENVRITIYKSNGDIAFLQNLDAVQSGLGQLIINTSSFANGLYLIQFAGSKVTKTFRIVIAN